MADIKRYSMTTIESNSTGEFYLSMREDEKAGLYVLHSDHLAAIKAAVAKEREEIIKSIEMQKVMSLSPVKLYSIYDVQLIVKDSLQHIVKAIRARGAAHDSK